MFHEDYMAKGWTGALPLPKGDKFPPPTGTTGNIAPLTKSAIDKMWDKAKHGSNIGLRLQVAGDYEVISLDVDHYDNKQGDLFLSEMEQELGQLNRHEIPRSTRRGVDSPSAQYFFRVPKGIKWKSSACSDVDIVQMTHRYAAVYPSVVDDMQYTWYQGYDEIEIPHVDDLPLLPERWVSFLQKSKVGKLNKKAKSNFTSRDSGDSYRDAYGWMRDNIPGWDSSENMSESLKKVSNSEDFLQQLQDNGHDTMVSAVHAAVMLGVEGHVGLKSALYKIKKNFMSAVVFSDKNRRSEAHAEKEFKSAVVGEVDRLIGEIAEGSVFIADYGAELALPNFRQMLTRDESAKRPLDVNLQEYPDTDHGHAAMVRDHWEKDFLVVEDGAQSEEFAIWVPKTARYQFQSWKSSVDRIDEAVTQRILHEAAKTKAYAESLGKLAEERQLKDDEMDPEELEAMAGKMKQRAYRVQDSNKRRSIMTALHGFADIRIDMGEFDASPEILGLPGGEVLDLDALMLQEDEFVRRGRQSDLITKSTSVRLVPNARSDAWDEFLDDFLPDKELRSFVQKVLGYGLLAGNPDKKVIFLFGPSNTGKTTLLESVSKALGDYAGPMDAVKLFGSSSGAPAPEMVESLNKRLVFMAEVGDDHRLSANSVKRVTGNDTQHVRQLHSNVMRSAAPKFTPFVSTNSVPEIRGVDQATKERIMVIPFNHAHPRKRITEENDLKTQHNSTAILWWVVEGARRYLLEGMDPKDWPEEVKAASGRFTTDTSPMQNFLEDTVTRTDNSKDRISIEELYQLWENWSIKNRVDKKEIGSVSDFRKSVGGNGWEIDRGTYKNRRNVHFIRHAKLAE